MIPNCIFGSALAVLTANKVHPVLHLLGTAAPSFLIQSNKTKVKFCILRSTLTCVSFFQALRKVCASPHHSTSTLRASLLERRCNKAPGPSASTIQRQMVEEYLWLEALFSVLPRKRSVLVHRSEVITLSSAEKWRKEKRNRPHASSTLGIVALKGVGHPKLCEPFMWARTRSAKIGSG